MATKKRTSIPLPATGIDWSTLVLDPPEQSTEPEPPPAEKPGLMRRLVGDTAASVARGAVQGVRMLTDVAGADNAASAGLRTVEDYIGSLQSASAKADQQEIAAILKDAEGKGILDQVIAGAKAFGVAPLQTTAQALGTSVPTLATALIPGAGPAAVMARTAAGLGMGAAQGVGGVKSSIYDEVLQAAKRAGASDDEAARRAAWAQSYSGPNAAQIALGAGLGAWAGRSGIEGALDRLVHGSTKAAPGMLTRVGMGAIAEGIPEAAQGGQEKYATNTALTNDGTPTDPWSGVVANATLEGLAGHAMGGLAGIPKPGDQLRQDKLPERGPMTRAVNAAVEAAAQKADAGAPVPADPTAPPPASSAAAQAAVTAMLDEERRKAEQAAAGQALFDRTYPGAAAAPAEPLQPVLPPEAGITPAAPAAPPDPDNTAARAQREADKPAEPTGEAQPGDVLNAQGKPFASMDAAMRKLAAVGGEATHELVRVRGGLVVRPRADAAPVVAEDAPSELPAAAGQPFTLDGKTWTLKARTDKALTVIDSDGQEKKVPAGGKLGQRIAAALAEPGTGAPAAAPDVKGAQDGQEEEGRRLLTPKGAGAAPAKTDRGKSNQDASPPSQPAPQQSGIEGVAPAPRAVTINGEQVALTDEQAAEWDRVGAEYKAKFDAAKATYERTKDQKPTDDPDMGLRSPKERFDAESKRLGMELSAERRRIAGKLTPKAQAAADTEAARIRVGDTVDTPEGTGEVTGNTYGKVRVKIGDRTVVVPHKQATKVEKPAAATPAPAPDANTAVVDPRATAPYYVLKPDRSGTRIPVPSPEAAAEALAKLRDTTGAEPVDGSIDVYDAQTGQPVFNVKPDGTVKKVETREEAEARNKKAIEDAQRTVEAPARAPAPAPAAEQPLKYGRQSIKKRGDEPWQERFYTERTDNGRIRLVSYKNGNGLGAFDTEEEAAAEARQLAAPAAPAPSPAPSPAPEAGQQDDTGDDPEMAAYENGLSAETRAKDKAKVAGAKPQASPDPTLDDELNDALGKLGDVLGDVFGAKKNITGPQYGAADLLPALSKVVELLVRKGFKSFAQAAGKAAQLMRANDKTAPHVDAITPRQWKAAYNAIAEGTEGTDSEEALSAMTADEVRAIVRPADSGTPDTTDAAQNPASKEKTDDQQPTQPSVDSGDQGGSGAPGRERGARPQQRDPQADPGDVEGAQPNDVAEPDGGRTDAAAGEGAAGADVGPAGGTAAGGNAGDGRKGAGRKGAPAAGARGRGGRAAADGAGKPVDPATVSPANTGPGDFVIADPLRIVGGGQVARFEKNKAAIDLRNRLVDAGRSPTREEQEVLAGYTGWGSFGQELFQGTWDRPAPKKGWEERDQWLRDNLGRKEWEGMQTSIINAHYTDPPTVMAMWDMVRRMGFSGGRTLEPSIGIGNFYGLMPADMTARSQRAGIELDPMTGSMAQMLYPQANIQIKGYEESTTPDNFYDLVIGNWPFFEEGPADRRYNRLSPTLHDYFFLKAIDQTKPGGLIVGITTKGTMDKKGINARMEMARKADLVAAFRLPSGAFEEYAGTKVVTDIIILRKRERPTDLVADAGWINVKDHDTAEGTKVPVNEYFHRNPSHVIGRIDFGHGTTTFRPGLIVHRPDDMMGELRRIVDLVPVGAFRAGADAKRISYVANHTSDRTNSLVKTDRGFFIVQGEYLAPANEVAKYELKDAAKTAKREKELAALIDLRRLYAKLIDAEREGRGDGPRAALRAAYDAFVKKSGPLAESFGLGYLRRIDDPFYPSLAALEISTVGKDGKTIHRPAAILSQSTMRGAAAMERPSITDAFVLARNNVVNPPLSLIAEIAKRPEAEVKKVLIEAGASFELPNGDFVPSDVYLSGNVREKLREAQAALKDGNAAMQRNVDALKEVLPPTIPYYKIETQMGATWVPARAYEQYIAHMLGMDDTKGISARFEGGGWKVDMDGALNQRPQARSGAGVQHVRFNRLVRAAISNQTINIKRKDSVTGAEYVDEDATKETNAAIADMRMKFGEWLWGDPTRRVELEAEYNEVRNAYATPRFDGSFLGFQGMALTLGRGPFNLRQHQANAIWRALVTRKSLNAHEVGTGKTFTMGGIAVESRRYGIAKKPLILAHNANSKSVAAEIQQMYPAAKVLYVDNLSKENVKTRMMQIANDDWDAIVVPHSLIDRLGFKEETLMGMAKEEIADLEIAAEEAADEDGVKIDSAMWEDEEELKKLRSPTAKQLVKQRLKIISTIKKLAQQASKEDSVAFEDLGVDMVMVDEAHEFKKPPIATKMKMKGQQTATSDRSIALMFMTKYVRAMNGGANVHLFTGTPITNTMTEVFHMMRYMMQEEMSAAAIADWDGWFGSFAREVNDVELNPAGEYEAVTRLQSFINVPELRRMIGQYMDVVFAEDMPEMQLRKVNGKRLTDKDLDDETRREILDGRTVSTPENPAGATDRPYKKVVNLNSDMDPAQLAVFEKVQRWARSWRSMGKKARKEAMSRGAPESPLIHEGIAARASFDVRLVEAIANAGKEGSPELAPHPDSKPARALQNLLDIYRGHPEANQVVFMDQGIARTVTRREGPPGQKRNVTYPAFSTAYDMIERLVQAGVPREQIALVDGSTSKDKRKEIADAMNSGKIRIVFGSSDSLGVGVNMQRNLRAMHHMDAPWMPGELEQRNGRGHRQGNQWNTVYEFRYLTDRLDGRRWQVLAIKQKFITDFMKAKGDVRVIEGDAADDSGGDILSTFSEAAGDPRLLLREKWKKKLEQLQSRERIHGNAVADARRAVDDQTRYIADDEAELERLREAGTREALAALAQRTMGDGFSARIGDQQFTSRKDAQDALKLWISENVRKGDDGRKQVGEFGGQPLYIEWRYKWSDEPTLVMDFPGKVEVPASPSWQSLETQIRQRRDNVESNIEQRLVERQEKLAHARKVAVEPFHMADKLAEAKKKLADLEEDIARNPVAPPYWLRAGAPMDTDVIYNGKTFTVNGHRWSDTGYYVVGADERGEFPIPYMEARDSQGMPLYEEREFKKPVVVQANGAQAVPPGGMKSGDPYSISDRSGAWKVLDRSGNSYAGQPDFASQAEAQLWADTRPDPTAPADVDAQRIADTRAQWEKDNGGPAPVFSRGRGPNRGVPMADAKAVVATIRQALPSAPPVHLLETLSQAPRALREQIKAQGAEDLEAAYHQGEIYVFPRNIESIERMQFVVGHHEIRHHGIRSRLGTGDELGAAMHAMWAGNQSLRKAAQAKLDAGLASTRALAVEEALADMPVEDMAKFKGFPRLVAAIRQWLRQVAAKLRQLKLPTLADAIEPKTWTDADVANFVLRAEGVSRNSTAVFRAGGTVFGRPDEQVQRGTEEEARAAGFTLKAYRGISKASPFNDSGTTWLTTSREVAEAYAEEVMGYDDPGVLEVMVKPDSLPRHDASRLTDQQREELQADEFGNPQAVGIYDRSDDHPLGGSRRNVTIIHAPKEAVWVVDGGGAVYSRPGAATLDSMMSAATARNVADRFNDLTRTAESFNWWHKTVGTQFHKAKTNPQFKRVYDKAQEYLHDTSAFANDPADLAADLLPQLRSMGDLKKKLALSKDDADKLSQAVIGGTLYYGRTEAGEVVEAGPDAPAGVRFTPGELRTLFGFNDRQVKLYQQFRAATDRSLDILVAADVARLLGDGLPPPLKAMISAGDTGRFKGLVTAWAKQQREKAEQDLAAMRKRHRNAMAGLNRRQKAALEGAGGRAGSRLANLEKFDQERKALKFQQGGEKYRVEQEVKKWADLDDTIKGKFKRIAELQVQGYAPLMRFGRYTVDVVGQDGARQFFGMFETEREANAAARKFREAAATEGEDLEVTQGILSEEAYKQFSGMTPETIELFAEVAGVEKNEAFQAYLRLAKNNRSAMKRLIHRTGVAGFSEDAQRVLAAFLTSNARAASSALHLGELAAVVEEIPKQHGDVKDEAIKLREYVQNPQEEAQAIRSLLFVQYLGGSVASAMVNMTQPLMMTLPYLSQFGGPLKAAARLAGAVRQAITGVDPKTELGRAMKLAEKEGITAPQELHQLQAEASRTLGNNPHARRLLFAWGSLFALAEGFNRRVSFIAAFNTAKEQKIEGVFSFAASTVDETQGVYNKANRPNWARGAVGATVFTFKQYSISYVEFLKRLPKRERALALAILVLAAGAQGLPGADDLDDLIDTLGQHLGHDTNSKLWKVRALNEAIGEDAADFVLHGFSALPGFPLDVAGRLGLGNLIPGTGLMLKSKADKSGEVAEAIGPMGSTLLNTAKAIPSLLSGDLARANAVAGPTALKNLGKALEMYQTGEYRDMAGRKVVDVDGADALIKAIVFQPAEVAQDSRKVQMANQQVGLARNIEAEIAGEWASGIVDKEPEKVTAARERLRDWNRANPESRIAITPQQIQRRVRDMRLARDARFTKAAPKEMRGAVREVMQ